MVILDIAVPRDFDPRIHDGDRACLFNVDDLKRIQEQTVKERQQHIRPAEAIIEQEVKRFLSDWRRRKNGPIIAQLTQDFESQRKAIISELFAKLNGKLSKEDREYIEGGVQVAAKPLPARPDFRARRGAAGAEQAHAAGGDDEDVSAGEVRNDTVELFNRRRFTNLRGLFHGDRYHHPRNTG